jgi:dihydrofolate reductase
LEVAGVVGLPGRRWYDVATSRYNGVRGIYGGSWSGPVFVLTHRPPGSAEDSSVTFLTDGIRNAVTTALVAANGKSIEIFGANTAQQCLEANLLDEIVVHLAPVLLGDGVRFYGGPSLKRIAFERTALAKTGQLTDLRFQVASRPSTDSRQ